MKLSKVFRLVNEATCPNCGGPNAYVGLNDVECPNPKCKNYIQGAGDPNVKPAAAPKVTSPSANYTVTYTINMYPPQYTPRIIKISFQSWKNEVEQHARRLCGPNWRDEIEAVQGQGAVDKMIDMLWHRAYDSEYAAGELAFNWEICNDGTISGYRYQQIANYDPQQAFDYSQDVNVAGVPFPTRAPLPYGNNPPDSSDVVFRPDR